MESGESADGQTRGAQSDEELKQIVFFRLRSCLPVENQSRAAAEPHPVSPGSGFLVCRLTDEVLIYYHTSVCLVLDGSLTQNKM